MNSLTNILLAFLLIMPYRAWATDPPPLIPGIPALDHNNPDHYGIMYKYTQGWLVNYYLRGDKLPSYADPIDPIDVCTMQTTMSNYRITKAVTLERMVGAMPASWTTPSKSCFTEPGYISCFPEGHKANAFYKDFPTRIFLSVRPGVLGVDLRQHRDLGMAEAEILLGCGQPVRIDKVVSGNPGCPPKEIHCTVFPVASPINSWRQHLKIGAATGGAAAADTLAGGPVVKMIKDAKLTRDMLLATRFGPFVKAAPPVAITAGLVVAGGRYFEDVYGPTPPPGMDTMDSRRVSSGAGVLESIKNKTAIAAASGPPSEFKNTLNEIYKDVLGREVDPEGVNVWWQVYLRSGMDGVLDGIERSIEYFELHLHRLYHAYLNRAPDQSGKDNWLRHFQAGWSLRDIEREIGWSSEAQKAGLRPPPDFQPETQMLQFRLPIPPPDPAAGLNH